jgi:hypothetical protein
MRYSVGNGRVVIPDPDPRKHLNLWTVALSDDPPVFWYWENTPTNHIWERIPTQDVPALVVQLFNKAKGTT